MEDKTGRLDSRRIYVQVLDHVRREIGAGRLAIGSKLPTERALAEELGVSRNSVREAYRVLEMMGAAVSIQGAGHYLANNFENTLVETLSLLFVLREVDFRQVSQLRRALEETAFFLAARRAGEADKTALREIISQLDMGLSEEENILLDKRLHYTIARASGNALIVVILNALSDVMDRFIADLRRDIMAEPERKERLRAAHRRMAESVIAGDAAGGLPAVAEHFDLVQARLEARQDREM